MKLNKIEVAASLLLLMAVSPSCFAYGLRVCQDPSGNQLSIGRGRDEDGFFSFQLLRSGSTVVLNGWIPVASAGPQGLSQIAVDIAQRERPYPGAAAIGPVTRTEIAISSPLLKNSPVVSGDFFDARTTQQLEVRANGMTDRMLCPALR